MTTTTLTRPKGGIDSFGLKIIAIVGMTLDHIAMLFGDKLPFAVQCFFNFCGGLTFPIMAFMITEGYRHTRDVKKYMKRLFLFALVAQIPYMWAFGVVPATGTSIITRYFTNVMFTLLAGLVAIYLTEHLDSKIAKVLAAAIMIAITLDADWGLMGPAMILLYYHGKKPWLNLILPIVVSAAFAGSIYLSILLGGAMFALPMVLYYFGGGIMTIILLHFYNGAKGRSMKYFFYIYYPLHLVVLRAILALMTGNWKF